MQLFGNIGELLTLQPAAAKEGRKVTEADLGITAKACFVVSKGLIHWVGPRKQLPKEFSRSIKQEIDLNGETVLPGFVECHTHLNFAGSRAHEFEKRNQGVSYLEITRQGGGIQSTVREVRKASALELTKLSQQRVDHFVAQGVTTLEIKSGYGLDLKSEVKMLKSVQNLKGPDIVSTFLGAHALAPEFSTTAEYLKFLESILLKIKKQKLASRVDIFIEKGFFEKEPAKQYLLAAQALGFEVVIHADQLTLSGGSDLAAELSALSADHVLQISEAQIQRLAKSQVTAVLLPLADLYMKVAYPPARQLIDAGARVALATDFNPGTAPSQDLNLVGLLARLEMKMSLPEVICAYTLGAASALKLDQKKGSLEVGKNADFVSTKLSWQDLFYLVGTPMASQVYLRGKRVFKSKV